VFHSIHSSLGLRHFHDNISCYDLHLTALSELSSFNTKPLEFFLTSQRTRINVFLVIDIISVTITVTIKDTVFPLPL